MQLYTAIINTLTLVATIAVAVGVYKLQRRENIAKYNKRIDAAKRYLGVAVSNAFLQMISPPEDSMDLGVDWIRDCLNRYDEEIADILSERQIYLLQLMDVVVKRIDKGEPFEDSFMYRTWLRKIMAGPEREKAICASNSYDLLNQEIYEMFKILQVPEAQGGYEEMDCIYANDGKELFVKDNTK